MHGLEGKLAVVTGGSRGIGRAIVEAIAAAGATVAFTYRSDEESAAKVETEVRRSGGSTWSSRVDVRREEQVARFFCEVDATGPVEILVNNAGVILERSSLETSARDLADVLATNVVGQFLCGREALRRMAGRGGRLINLSSDLAFTGREQFAAYCASKGAINALTKSWAREFAPEVLVNAIAPGPIDTDMLGSEQMSEAWRAREEELTALGRIGTPAEVASVALLLAGSGGSYLTGQVIGPNGGSVMP